MVSDWIKIPSELQWKALSNPPEVMPLQDTREHIEGDGCWCRPTLEDDVIVHRSMDGREKYETGERKPL